METWVVRGVPSCSGSSHSSRRCSWFDGSSVRRGPRHRGGWADEEETALTLAGFGGLAVLAAVGSVLGERRRRTMRAPLRRWPRPGDVWEEIPSYF
ncbi:hypothetical protein [Rhizohabitans arisaemae]|uniref:hypothetical protein n=1 Tax=Rhizohabitans arisaemae TaxID=2720610 RepID=UPI0024B1D1F0|nr:hypothetical protein [Rhizohabitans arisaemae]